MKLVISLIGMDDVKANELFKVAVANGYNVGDGYANIKSEDGKEAFLSKLLGYEIDYDDGYSSINEISVRKDLSSGLSARNNILSMSVDEIYDGSFERFVEYELYVYYDSQIRTSYREGDYLSFRKYEDKMDFLFAWLGVDIDVPRGQKHHLVEFIDEIKIHEKNTLEEER